MKITSFNIHISRPRVTDHYLKKMDHGLGLMSLKFFLFLNLNIFQYFILKLCQESSYSAMRQDFIQLLPVMFFFFFCYLKLYNNQGILNQMKPNSRFNMLKIYFLWGQNLCLKLYSHHSI